MPQAESRRAREALIAKLRDILPRQFVLTETEQLRPYECDGLTAYRQLPWIVVLPSNGDEVEKLLGVCTAHGVPGVARGGWDWSVGRSVASSTRCVVEHDSV